MLFIQQKCIILTVGAMHCIISLAHIPRKRETTYLMFNICTSFRTGKPIREIAENQKNKEVWNELIDTELTKNKIKRNRYTI